MDSSQIWAALACPDGRVLACWVKRLGDLKADVMEQM